ncbi:MAG: ribonuclease R [Chlorobium limicola]|uniref:Ribonuclease R n=1 Tax=Chlorobium limicola (strain DSM 245 / NBRC 103803 / 6330) TaxID=290315 RepID=B3EGD8_CHLL2|nr:ribonuclease R [Chlorobium limicola]ACD89575.1 ribonuclease R [Chlorobium limicola DSM 245]NTV21337.1 ribonuclease R [Chlorobium limicola]
MARQRYNRKPGSSGKKNSRPSAVQNGDRVRPNDHILINEFLFRRGESSLAAEIVSFLTDHDGERFRSVDLARKMGYTESIQLPGFWYVLHKLQEDGTVDKDSNRAYGMQGMEPATYEEVLEHTRQFPLPGKEQFKVDQTYVGRLITHPNGYGFVDVEGFDDDIFVKAGDLNSAIHGDEIEVVVTKVPETYSAKSTPHQRCEGIVVNVVTRKISAIVGTLSRENRKFVLKADDRKLLPEIIVPIKQASGAKDGEKVLVGDLDFRKPGIIQARVLEILGSAGDSRVEVSAIARNHGIDETFDEELINFAGAIKEGITDDDLKNRLDIRDKNVFTIDPVDAKDFDDALSIETLDDNLYRIGVHIADVSHYVPENSPLDREAMKRATSVYLVDRVIPMLPSRLSEQVCSLNPGVDRMAFSVFITMTESGEVREHAFHKTVIHSKRRYTYEDVQEILLKGEGDNAAELQLLEKISVQLREERFRHGGLDFETEEVRFRLGSKGEPVEVIKKERLSSHRLIEEFMLLANRKVAEYLTKTFRERKKNPQPVIYRVHDAPQQERVLVLANFVRKIGYTLKINREKTGPIVSAKALRQLLQQVHGSNVEFLVNELVLRCMSKAIYTDENTGHFGLGFEHYTHFTSPIRRYPDLIVHRLLFEYENLRNRKKKITDKRLAELSEKIRVTSRISNEREKSAVEAERESIKLKQVEYMAGHLGNVYQGIISGATEYGIYVRMVDFAIEGLVHMRNLTDDYYEYDEATYSLIGKRRKRRLQIGQRVKVKVHMVDMQRRTIDLVIE